jgi:hypothetical protein
VMVWSGIVLLNWSHVLSLPSTIPYRTYVQEKSEQSAMESSEKRWAVDVEH